ncbi:hypothetical protein BB558_006479, partial [Smittium angustum]
MRYSLRSKNSSFSSSEGEGEKSDSEAIKSSEEKADTSTRATRSTAKRTVTRSTKPAEKKSKLDQIQHQDVEPLSTPSKKSSTSASSTRKLPPKLPEIPETPSTTRKGRSSNVETRQKKDTKTSIKAETPATKDRKITDILTGVKATPTTTRSRATRLNQKTDIKDSFDIPQTPTTAPRTTRRTRTAMKTTSTVTDSEEEVTTSKSLLEQFPLESDSENIQAKPVKSNSNTKSSLHQKPTTSVSVDITKPKASLLKDVTDKKNISTMNKKDSSIKSKSNSDDFATEKPPSFNLAAAENAKSTPELTILSPSATKLETNSDDLKEAKNTKKQKPQQSLKSPKVSELSNTGTAISTPIPVDTNAKPSNVTPSNSARSKKKAKTQASNDKHNPFVDNADLLKEVNADKSPFQQNTLKSIPGTNEASSKQVSSEKLKSKNTPVPQKPTPKNTPVPQKPTPKNTPVPQKPTPKNIPAKQELEKTPSILKTISETTKVSSEQTLNKEAVPKNTPAKQDSALTPVSQKASKKNIPNDIKSTPVENKIKSPKYTSPVKDISDQKEKHEIKDVQINEPVQYSLVISEPKNREDSEMDVDDEAPEVISIKKATTQELNVDGSSVVSLMAQKAIDMFSNTS